MDMSSGGLKAPANSAILRRENNIRRSRGRPNLKELFIRGEANLICEEAIKKELETKEYTQRLILR
jgi:hypothetical protein